MLNYRNIICEGLLLIFFSIMMKTWLLGLKICPYQGLSTKTIPYLWPKWPKSAKIDTLFCDQNGCKNIAFGAAHTYITLQYEILIKHGAIISLLIHHLADVLYILYVFLASSSETCSWNSSYKELSIAFLVRIVKNHLGRLIWSNLRAIPVEVVVTAVLTAEFMVLLT